MSIFKIMSTGVDHCTPETDLAAAAMIMWRSDCGIVPVVDRLGPRRGSRTVANSDGLATWVREDVASPSYSDHLNTFGATTKPRTPASRFDSSR